ncbi:MAG: alkene reductase [Deltaproteobacteria bacterium]|nr:alkene reductase [Nannocystaceae bacterium]
MSESILFTPHALGPITLKNRVVMAPMTRSRAIDNVHGELAVQYYSERAEAGLIVTEGTSPAPEGLGYPRIPGLYDDSHVRGWKPVTAAVHAAGSRIFVQLMHTGRTSHPDNLPSGSRMLAPSEIAVDDKMYVDGKGPLPMPVPEAMTAKDIEHTIEQYVHSAQLAIDAGFDGVELHGANGYLIDQFLNTASNQRTDEWGGSVENRIRFGVEVAKRVAARIGGDRLGIRISPYGAFNGMRSDDDAVEDVFESFARKLSEIGLVYLHTVDHQSMGAPEVKPSIKRKLRAAFPRTIILSGGYDRARAEADLVEKRGELVAFARDFLSNPRLVSKMRDSKPLTPVDQDTFYTPGPVGYTDYPAE